MRKSHLSIIISILLIIGMILPAFAADPVLVDNISLEPDNIVISVGKTANIKAAISPKNATSKKLEWSSSDETIATIQNGKVKGIAPGTAAITVKATDESGVNTVIEVIVVQPIGKITVHDPKLILPPGSTWEQIAYIEPQDATLKTLDWTSSNEKVATVDSDGIITAVAVGKCNIVGAAKDDSRKKVTVSVQVADFEILILKPGSVSTSFSMDETEGFAMGVTSRGAYQDSYKTTVRFETGCVTRSGDNTLIPVAAGTDTITITETHNGVNTRKEKHTVFVSQAAVRDEGAIPQASASGDVLFRDIPWGSSFDEVQKLLSSRGESLHGAAVRNGMLWTRIDGDISFGNFKAYNNGLNFTSEGLDKEKIEESKSTCSFCMGDYYFDLDIPFENLKQNVMKAYNLPKNETTDSNDECTWTVGDVTISLFVKPKYTQLKISNLPAAEEETGES